MRNNGSQSPLDRVLATEPAEIKVQVLDYLYTFGIEHDDEFYAIIAALGYLKALIKEAPESWKVTFNHFSNDLDQWKHQNLETLENLAKFSQEISKLTTELSKLSGSTKKLAPTLQRLDKTSSRLQSTTTTLTEQSKATSKNISQILSDQQNLNQMLTSAQTQLTQLSQTLTQPSQTRNKSNPWNLNWKLSFSIFAAGLILANGFAFYTIWAQMNDQSRRIEWLLEKGNRRDCAEGYLPSDSPECQ